MHPNANVCSCGAMQSEDANAHMVKCRSNTAGWCHVHNRVVHTLARAASDVGYTAQVRDFTKMKQDHHVVPDLKILGDKLPIMVDVSFVAVNHDDYRDVDVKSKDPQARSAMRRETEKEKHYHGITRNGSCVFSPLVLERESLAIGPKSLALINTIEAQSRGSGSLVHLTSFTIITRLLIAACTGNAVLAREARKKDARAEAGQYRHLIGGPADEASSLSATFAAAHLQ